MLTLDGVSKVYRIGTFGGGRLRAVRDVSLTVQPGEIVALIGESGSGKSTIGKMILGLERPTEGAITFNGIDVTALRHRHELGEKNAGVSIKSGGVNSNIVKENVLQPLLVSTSRRRPGAR